jgi:hypothetical protein
MTATMTSISAASQVYWWSIGGQDGGQFGGHYGKTDKN